MKLSKRQAQVMRLVGEGNRDKEIATILCISTRTVERHIKDSIERLSARTRTHAVKLLIENKGM